MWDNTGFPAHAAAVNAVLLSQGRLPEGRWHSHPHQLHPHRVHPHHEHSLDENLLRSRRRPRGSLYRWAGGDCPPGINYFCSWRIIMAVVVKIHIYCWNIQVGLVLIFPDVCWAQFFFAKRFQHLKGIGYQVWVYLVKTLKATVKQTNISKTE